MSETREGFFSRWSRLKRRAPAADAACIANQPASIADRQTNVAGAADDIKSPVSAGAESSVNPASANPGAGIAVRTGKVELAADLPAELPDVDNLTMDSDYSLFLRPEVDESVRRTALRKLLRDPHFNVMDGLDVYIEDFGKADPIPSKMMASQIRQMLAAQGHADPDDGRDRTAIEAGAEAADAKPSGAEFDAGQIDAKEKHLDKMSPERDEI